MKEGETKICAVVYTNTDLTEGRGYQFPIAVCETVATARRLAKKAYVMGSDAPVEEREVIRHNGEWYGPVRVVQPTAEDMIVQAAFTKQLSALEKAKAAGLTDEDINALRNRS